MILGQYYTLFEFPDSEWYSVEPRMDIKVYDLDANPEIDLGLGHMFNSRPAVLILEIEGEEKRFIMIGGRGVVEILGFDDFVNNEIDGWNNTLFMGFARHRRSFFSREIVSFTIDIRGNEFFNELFNGQYDRLVFNRRF